MVYSTMPLFDMLHQNEVIQIKHNFIRILMYELYNHQFYMFNSIIIEHLINLKLL